MDVHSGNSGNSSLPINDMTPPTHVDDSYMTNNTTTNITHTIPHIDDDSDFKFGP